MAYLKVVLVNIMTTFKYNDYISFVNMHVTLWSNKTLIFSDDSFFTFWFIYFDLYVFVFDFVYSDYNAWLILKLYL